MLLDNLFLLFLFGSLVQSGDLAEALLAAPLPEFTCGQLSASGRIRGSLPLGRILLAPLGRPAARLGGGQFQLEVEILTGIKFFCREIAPLTCTYYSDIIMMRGECLLHLIRLLLKIVVSIF